MECGTYNNNIGLELLVSIANALEIDPVLLFTFSDYERSKWKKSSGAQGTGGGRPQSTAGKEK